MRKHDVSLAVGAKQFTLQLMTAPVTIEPLGAGDFAAFIAYLNDHLADNGDSDAGYFQPLPRDHAFFPADREAAFRTGLDAEVGARGWRRAWVARSAAGQIAGHIDLRAHRRLH